MLQKPFFLFLLKLKMYKSEKQMFILKPSKKAWVVLFRFENQNRMKFYIYHFCNDVYFSEKSLAKENSSIVISFFWHSHLDIHLMWVPPISLLSFVWLNVCFVGDANNLILCHFLFNYPCIMVYPASCYGNRKSITRRKCANTNELYSLVEEKPRK